MGVNCEDDPNCKTWALSDRGMDLFERAGLAGLYMALDVAREQGHDLSPIDLPACELADDHVTVRWRGPARAAFAKLMAWAWQVREGMLLFPAVHDEKATANIQFREATHNGVMNTYFQNPNVQPTLDVVERVIQIDGEDRSISVRYKPPAERVDDLERGINPNTGRPHKRPVPTNRLCSHRVTECDLFDEGGNWRTRPVEVSNWLYPGVAGRYASEPSWCGAAERAYLLMLVPTIALFLRLTGEGNNWTAVVPDVRNLEAFAATRKHMVLNADFIDVASLGDAGLKFLAEYATRDARADAGAGCRVVAMGRVGYYQNQSIRKGVLDVSATRRAVDRYRTLLREFPNQFQRRQTRPSDTPAADGTPPKKPRKKATPPPPAPEGPQPTGFFVLPTGRGRIADNLVSGREWYRDLFVPLPWDEREIDRLRGQIQANTSTERLWFTALSYQRSRLMRLITDDDMWDSEAERLFVTACWETLDSLYAQEAEAVKRGGERTPEDRWEHLNEEIRRTLMQAKTRNLLRSAMAEWFAKAGRQKTITAHAAPIWRLIDHPEHWRKGRDLGLLALASHRKKEVREGKVPPTPQETAQ